MPKPLTLGLPTKTSAIIETFIPKPNDWIIPNEIVGIAVGNNTLKIDLGELSGPKAIAFGTDTIAPIKALSDFAKEHPALQLKVGFVDGEVADENMLKSLAAIPGRDTLLTQIAAGLMQHVKNVAICLDLHAKNLEENK